MKKFTEISSKACELKSCWSLYCTTCGNRDLMLALTKPVFPSAEKGLHRSSQNNPLSHQEEMLDFYAKDIDIFELKEKSCFPDWLGHIGLLLSSCQKAEEKNRSLTNRLLPEFKLMLKDNQLVSRINSMISNDEIISTNFLESIERALIKN